MKEDPTAMAAGLPETYDEHRKDKIILVGEAMLPEKLQLLSRTGFLTVVVEMNGESGTVRGVECRELPPVVERLIADQLIGNDLQIAMENIIKTLQRSLYARSKGALIEALRVVQRQFELWKQESHQESGGESKSSTPAEPGAAADLLNGGQSVDAASQDTRHGLATQLISLLAHARLLDDREKRGVAGQQISREARQQAIRLYAITQQILHKVEAEPGLLQPQIEPILVPDLIQQTLFRLAISGRRLSVEQRLPADLPPIRGDAVALEEALFLLFGEMATCADAKETVWEIGAERRKTDMLITIQRHSKDGPADGRTAREGEEEKKGREPSFWDGNLCALAARALVEHQGGRLWIQETFPQDKSCLCLSLQSQSAQDEAKYPQTPNKG